MMECPKCGEPIRAMPDEDLVSIDFGDYAVPASAAFLDRFGLDHVVEQCETFAVVLGLFPPASSAEAEG